MDKLGNSSWDSISLSSKEGSTGPIVSYEKPTEVKNDDIAQAKTQKFKEISAADIIKKNRIKKFSIVGFILIIIIAPILYYFSRPGKEFIYKKHEEFGPCISGKGACFQDIIVYASGDVIYTGKINKQFSISNRSVRNIKKEIRDSKLMDTDCKETQIVMEYKITHTLFIDGVKKEIQAPGCESELESLDQIIEQKIK